MLDPRPPITARLDDPALAGRLVALAGADAPPVTRWRFTPRRTVGGREVLSTTRLVPLDDAVAAWAGAARVVLCPLTPYHGHLLIGWTTEGAGDGGEIEVAWDPSAWSPVGVW